MQLLDPTKEYSRYAGFLKQHQIENEKNIQNKI